MNNLEMTPEELHLHNEWAEALVQERVATSRLEHALTVVNLPPEYIDKLAETSARAAVRCNVAMARFKRLRLYSEVSATCDAEKSAYRVVKPFIPNL